MAYAIANMMTRIATETVIALVFPMIGVWDHVIISYHCRCKEAASSFICE